MKPPKFNMLIGEIPMLHLECSVASTSIYTDIH